MVVKTQAFAVRSVEREVQRGKEGEEEPHFEY